LVGRQLQLSTFLTIFIISLTLLLSKPILFSLFNTAIAAPSTTRIPITGALETKILTYMISTRGNATYPQEVNGSGYNNNYLFSNLTRLFESCAPEVVIFVHGWKIDENLAKERLDRVKLSLEKNNYTYPLVGFSWNSNNLWEAAKSTAKENGPKLAHFILNLKDRCQDTKVRLIAHSIGARVALSSLDSLHKNSIWNNGNYTLTSVHLLAAAVDDEEVSKNPSDIIVDPTNVYSVKSAYGEAIEEEVDRFYNLRSSEDNVLEKYPFQPFDFAYKIYPLFEGDFALGQKGYQNSPNITLPENYNEEDIKDQIKDIYNADAVYNDDFGLCNNVPSIFTFCKIKEQGWDFGLCNSLGFCRVTIGDNHGGYIGFRNLNNTSLLADDGAIGVVVAHWNSE
jgi:pimeloyl-ACP methyl ester carboxylesterase